ncbi:MAG: anthranilate synthase component I [Cyanobacteria bacterium J06638_28]
MLQPWYVRSHPLQGRTGSDIFQGLYQQPAANQRQNGYSQPWQQIATLLESPYPLPKHTPSTRIARYSICAGPPRVCNQQPLLWTPAVGTILPMLSQRLTTPQPPAVLLDATTGNSCAIDNLPFAGGWLGWLGYDLAWEIEVLPTLNTDPLPFPVAFWYEPATFAVLDHEQQQLWLAASNLPQLVLMETALAATEAVPPLTPVNFTGGLTLASSQAEYEAAVRQAKQHIQAGDVFQTNLSLRFATQTTAASWAIYRRLHSINPSPFASYWCTPWGAVVSCSPERLVSLHNDIAETRPIAGTRSRGKTPAQDQALSEELRANTKEKAEHIMLVDLERNDLGRVCTWGTITVDELMTIEPYSHVMHLVSNVVGTLAPEHSAIDLIRAVFPGGTITGCPKVRCMEIIEALEPLRRNLFYGSCGYLDYRGHLDLNILIRTLLWTPGGGDRPHTVWGQVGAGIVADSQPTQEWQESLQKAKAQLLSVGINLEHLTPTTTTSKARSQNQ